ncbi:MAG: metallophosphoesterase family protein [Firmicutes bacterium]|nr:metallophosphoesterase family protein [Bacillota bacterium]
MSSIRIGVISDTHGLLRSDARLFLQKCDRIIHAGDIDQHRILQELNQIAPTTAVRGNMDQGPWANSLRTAERIQVDHWSILVVHNIQDLPPLNGANIVIFGHSHKFFEETNDGVLYLNPGSAGPKRFSLPISMAILTLSEKASVEHILLKNKA